jgi:GT2 family glycosyltransferase/glycosyltransferase involved in cell wall biosynthesis
MRVLIVVHGFPPQVEGGSEVYVHAHARALARHFGDDVLVLTREQDPERPEYSVRTEERNGLRIVRINNTFRRTRSFEESYRSETVCGVACGIIDEFRPEVAHIHHLTCLSTMIVPALAERRIPCFFTLHDYWLICHRGQLFDLDHRVCSGPDASGCCRRCLGPHAAAPPSAFLAARAMRTVEKALPRRAATLLRDAAGRIASFAGDPEHGDAEARRRVEHMRRIAADVTLFLAPSQYLREQFVRFGIPPERIVHAPLGFDHAPFQRDDILSQSSQGPQRISDVSLRGLGGPGGEPRPFTRDRPLRLGFIGSLMVSKAPHLLIEAALGFERGAVSVDLVGAHAAYHGDDGYRHQLAPLLASGGIRHHGPVPHARIPEVLASIDVLVVPSVWPENSPLVIHEAFLAGVPVIASRIGGIPELVKDGRNGLLVAPGDTVDLSGAIARVLREPGLLECLRAGIEPERTIEADVTSIRELYEKGVGRGFPRESQENPSRPLFPGRRTAAVVLNYRTPDDTLLAVRSLLASRRPLDDIIVVNNDVEDAKGPAEAGHHGRRADAGHGSSGHHEGPAETAPSGTPGQGGHHGGVEDVEAVTCVQTGCNLGFSGGVNVGIRAALERGADAVLLVNSDVIVPPDCIDRLERALGELPGAGIAGPVIADRSAPADVASRGISYNPATGRMRHNGAGEPVSARARPDCAPVDGVSACLMLVKREVFDAIGLFDEDYFFSFEDLDFCLRARRAGFATVLAGHATAYHEGSRSIGVASPARLYFAARNHLLLASRTTPARSAARHLYRVSAIVTLNLAHAAISHGGSWPRRITAVVRGTRDYFAGRFGPKSEV